MSDLIDAQQELIAAQHKFLRDADITALVIAQTEMLQTQGHVIARLITSPNR